MQRLAFVDAMSYWMSAAIPNDQFLVYCFADSGRSRTEIAEDLWRRVHYVDDLSLAIMNLPGTLDRPYWVASPPERGQLRVHDEVQTWTDVLAALAEAMADQLVPSVAAWRVHVFGPVSDVPRAAESTTVVVLQIAHALGDGRRTSQVARQLFTVPVDSRPPITSRADGVVTRAVAILKGGLRFPVQSAEMVGRGLYAWRVASDEPTHGNDTGYPLTQLNVASGRERSLRVIVVDRAELTGGAASVTVAVLTAISVALPAYLNEPSSDLGVELTVGRDPEGYSRNNFRNVGVNLHLDVADLAERARRIADDIAAARRVSTTPAREAARRASAATPAALTYWGLRQFDPDRPPERVTGVTVVSSVDRGADDLTLGGGRVLFSTGFPALSPAQGLTHGVHGIGGTIAIAVTTSPDVMPDVDHYTGLLTGAVATVAEALAARS